MDSARKRSASETRNISNSIKKLSPRIPICNEKLASLKNIVNDLVAEQNIEGPCFITLGVSVQMRSPRL